MGLTRCIIHVGPYASTYMVSHDFAHAINHGITRGHTEYRAYHWYLIMTDITRNWNHVLGIHVWVLMSINTCVVQNNVMS